MTALGLAAGMVLDAALGDPRRGHPVALHGALAQRAETLLYRDQRGRGVAYTALLVGGPALVAAALDRGGSGRRTVLLAGVTWTAVGARSLGREARGVARAVAAGDLAEARRRVPALVGRDPSGLDGPELCRAAVESVAENTADAVVAPLVWGAVAGPAGVVAHRCANTLDAMVGHRSPRYRHFGWASARLDDALALVPARLTAALAVALAPVVGGTIGRAARITLRDRHRSPSPNAGQAEAAFAGALGVRLGGVNRYGERVEVRGPLGEGPVPGPADVERAVRLSRAVGAAATVLAVLARARLLMGRGTEGAAGLRLARREERVVPGVPVRRRPRQRAREPSRTRANARPSRETRAGPRALPSPSRRVSSARQGPGDRPPPLARLQPADGSTRIGS